MSYPKEVYDKAFSVLAQRRQRAKNTAVAHKTELYRRIPRLEEIERELAGIGVAIARDLLSSENPDELVQDMMQSSVALQSERERLLLECGYPENYLEVNHYCAECQDTGATGTRRCSCLKDLLRREAYSSLNSISSLSEFGFEKFSLSYYSESPIDSTGIPPRKRMAEIFDLCVDYAKFFSLKSQSLLFIGKTGLGKTHLSLSIAAQVVERGYGVAYTSAQNLIHKISSDMYSNDANASPYLSYAMEADLLIIDDLGAEHNSPYNVSVIYNVINSRILERRPTIISANLELDDIASRYSERIVSRLLGEYKTLMFIGEDIRAKKRMLGKSYDLSSPRDRALR